MSATTVLATASLAATLGYLAIFIAWHVLPTGYDPVRHAVSDYAVGPYGYLFRIGLYVSAVSIVLLAFALLAGVGSPPIAARDVAYLFGIPVARIAMTLFPTTVEGTRLDRTGAVHYLFAIAAFALTYLVISETTPHLHDAGLRWTAHIVGPALALVVVTMVRPLRRVFGLFERVFLVTTNMWFALAAVLLISRAS